METPNDLKIACEMLANKTAVISALHEKNDALVEALEDMLHIFDRESSAPRLKGLSIGAMACDKARAALELNKSA